MKGEGYMIKSPVIKYLTVLFSITCLTGCSGAYTGSFPAETVPGTASREEAEAGAVPALGNSTDSGSKDTENSDPCEADYIDLTENEKRSVQRRISSAGDLCREIYAAADKGSSSNIVLDEEIVHEMIAAVSGQGAAVTCGSYDFNMLNYEKTDSSLRDAAEGKHSNTEFYEITASGHIKYFALESEKGEMTVTYANSKFNEDAELRIQQLEKFRVYDWEYTDKGWLIWEQALSRNQEMDMHSFFRILPLDEMCRELGNQYILPVSYFCNNLFLTEWDTDSMDKIEFNDLYDFLYAMKYGEALDADSVQGGIPKDEFESVVLTFFDLPKEALETIARYDSGTGLYPWEAIGAWNRVRQLQPFPEVVKCTENPDGTWALDVEAILIENGDDCAFRHTVTMKEEDGRWIYLGNHIPEEEKERAPGYRPRREFAGQSGQ